MKLWKIPVENYKVALDKRKEAGYRENEKHLARKQKQEMIKEIEEAKDMAS